MKCPVCIEKGLKTTVSIGMTTSTEMWCPPYYDEEGRFHHHDGNIRSTQFNCSKGHVWSVSAKGKCPSCDFGNGSESISIQNDADSTATYNSDGTITIIASEFLTITNGTGIASSSSARPQFLTLT